MFHSLLLLALVAASSAMLTSMDLFHYNTSTLSERIIGGKEVVRNSYPFVVRIVGTKADGNSFICGGSLVSPNFVLTAGHCVKDDQMPVYSLNLFFGDHHIWQKEATETEMAIPMNYVFAHQQYNQYNLFNDIALIRLPRPAPISQYVRPICLASAQRAAQHQGATAIGWGMTSSPGGQISVVLKEVNLPFLGQDGCHRFPMYNPTTMICAGNTRGHPEAVCQGDSGGPYVINPNTQPALVGLTSFGSPTGCHTVGYGGVFTRVAAYLPWIRSIAPDVCIA